MKKWVNGLLEKWHLKWAKKNMVLVTLVENENICWQMHQAGVRWEHMNKWRKWRRLDPIAGYTTKDKQVVRWFTGQVTAEDREKCFAAGEHLVLIG